MRHATSAMRAILCDVFPPDSEADAVRFTKLEGKTLFILEKDYIPVRHGSVDMLEGALARQAEVFPAMAEPIEDFSTDTPRPVRESASEYSEIALPNDANHLGNMLGGRVMHLVDLAGALAAARHSRCAVVTASVDSMTFLHPIHIGQLVLVEVGRESSVSDVDGGGCEGVRRGSAHGSSAPTSSAYLTFVALGANNERTPLPPVIPETEEEQTAVRIRARAAGIQAIPEEARRSRNPVQL